MRIDDDLPQEVFRAAGCEGKQSFANKGVAERIAKRMRRRKADSRSRCAYLCDHCGQWHIGNRGHRP